MSGNGPDQRFADSDLLAYLSGDADDETRRAIEDALPHDDDLATRLRALDRFDDVVEPAFRALLAQAPAEALADRYVAAAEESAAAAPAAAQPRRRSYTAGLAAATALGLAVAFVAGAWIGRDALAPPAPVVAEAPPKPGWLVAVADYVKLFSADTLASTQQAPADLARNLAFVSERVAMDLTPLATALPGLDLKRTELLQLNGRPLAQVAYLHVSGQTVAICVLLRPEGATPPTPHRRTSAASASARSMSCTGTRRRTACC